MAHIPTSGVGPGGQSLRTVGGVETPAGLARQFFNPGLNQEQSDRLGAIQKTAAGRGLQGGAVESLIGNQRQSFLEGTQREALGGITNLALARVFGGKLPKLQEQFGDSPELSLFSGFQQPGFGGILQQSLKDQFTSAARAFPNRGNFGAEEDDLLFTSLPQFFQGQGGGGAQDLFGPVGAPKLFNPLGF